MAKTDYDDVFEAAAAPLTAGERVNETVSVTPDADNKAEALNAGVRDAAFIDYDVALRAHEARDDIETLAARRARENGDDFLDGAFMRELPNRSGGNGFAPGPDNDIVVSGYGGADSNPSTPA